MVTDYRFRGVSLSDEQPAVQAGLTATHASGVYGDLFVSSIDEYGIGPDGDGAEVEVTTTLGWTGQLAGYDVAVAAAAYHYPGGNDVDYVEMPLQIGRTHGALAWAIGASYAPAQTALGDEDNRYGWTSLTYAPATWPVSLTGRIGHERGAFAPEGKTDWALGVDRDLGAVGLYLSWIDSDADRGLAVASVFLSF